jgi:hypothetical protein
MTELTKTDMHFVCARLPKDLVEVVKKHNLIVAGGFIRDTIAGNKMADIDIFGVSVPTLELASLELSQSRKGRLFKSDNAITVLSPPRLAVQFIKRWLFNSPVDCVNSFDFTVCQAAIWFSDNEWHSAVSDGFYPDLAARRLVYTFPHRNEDAGGSMLRIRKFLRRGYNIQSASIAGVVTRLVFGLKRPIEAIDDEHGVSRVLIALLREVDPLTVVDGVDMVDEHEVVDQQPTEGDTP